MKSMIKIKQSNQGLLLIFLGWLVYTTSYLGKVNYSANITQIIDFYGITKTEAGIVPTFFFVAYGLGQFINGFFCRKYNIKWIIFFSLLISSIINFTIAVSTNFAIVKWLWMVNGFVLSMLWPTLIRMLSENLSKKLLGTSSVVMGTTVALGTLTIYGLSSIYAAFNKFKLAFYTAAFVVIIVSFVWLISYGKAVTSAKEGCRMEDSADETKRETTTQEKHVNSGKNILATVIVLCFYAIGINLTKDGLTTWVPSILKEEFCLTDSISILLTLFLPVLAVFGNAFALRVHKKVPDYINHCVIIFAAIAIFIFMIIGSMSHELVVFMVLGLVIVNFLASSLNSLITAIFPLFMREKVNSGKIAGVINGFCYLGSAISSYGLGFVADNFGWTSVFYVLIGFCVISFIIWCGYKCYLNKRAA